MGRHALLREVRFTGKKRGLMTAKIRLAIAALMTGILLGAAPARAQDPAPATTNSTEQVGPRELQDFNLQGTVTRPADPPPAPAQSDRPEPATRPAANPATSPPPRPIPETATERRPAALDTRPAERPAPATSSPPPAVQPSSSITAQLPPVGDSPTDSSPGGGSTEAAPAMPAPANDVPLPWLVAAALLLAGAGVYFWRNRQREALAGGADYDGFEAYQPGPPTAPPAAAGQRLAPEPDPIGIVSTRLRPWLEIAFRPLRCKIDDENVTFEFELGLFNSGSTPARAILVEASYFNAGEDQDRNIEQFFANPVGAGERAVSLAPLKRMVIKTKVVTPRAQVREFEAGGRKVFVPLIGFNTLYRWATGEGQTSASFILGRKTDGEKLAPFRLDMVDREFRALGKRDLPAAVRQ